LFAVLFSISQAVGKSYHFLHKSIFVSLPIFSPPFRTASCQDLSRLSDIPVGISGVFAPFRLPFARFTLATLHFFSESLSPSFFFSLIAWNGLLFLS